MDRLISDEPTLKEAMRKHRYEEGHTYTETANAFTITGVNSRKTVRRLLKEITFEHSAELFGRVEQLVEKPYIPHIAAPQQPVEKTENGSRIRLVVGLPDMHLPYRPESPLALSAKAAIRWCSEHKPDEIVLMGDFMSFKCIAHWDEAFPGRKANDFLTRDLDIGNFVLDIIQRTCGKTTYLEGNHEKWLCNYRDKDPHARNGIYELESVFRLYDRKIDLIPENIPYEVGRAKLVHGYRAGMYHARWTADDYGEPVFYGHTHDVQCHSKSKRSGGDPIIAHSCGCLCDENPEYLRNKPTRWAAGFLILYVRDDGSFTYYVPQIINGSFIYAGKEYKG